MRPRYDPYIILKECQGTPKPHGAVDKFEGDSKQPLGHQVLAYRNVMRCKWAVRKTARPKNGGRFWEINKEKTLPRREKREEREEREERREKNDKI